MSNTIKTITATERGQLIAMAEMIEDLECLQGDLLNRAYAILDVKATPNDDVFDFFFNNRDRGIDALLADLGIEAVAEHSPRSNS